MSAVTADVRHRAPLARLTVVELRKAVDTRAGFWLLLTIALLTALVLVLLVATGSDWSAQDAMALALAPSSFLLPVVGILLVTSEFSQRTALTTFTLVPSRSRVAAAKFLAALGLAAVTTVICVVGAALAVAVGGGDGSLTGELVGEGFVFSLLNIAMGFGFGILLLNSALAIVLSFMVPIAWSILVEAVRGLHGVRDWLDTGNTWAHLVDGGDVQWERIAASAALWILVPVGLGLLRLLRTDVK